MTVRLPTPGADDDQWGAILNNYLLAGHNATGQNIFTPSVTGAVQRTVDSKLSDSVNVKDFGAIGDGMTDDTIAIQAALDYCRTSHAGLRLYFPWGQYKVTSSLNCTYSGEAGGLTSGYYGFTIEGDDPNNTVILGRCSGVPVLDLTGKSRMIIRNIGICNSSNDGNNPSCAILLARNQINGNAGGHTFQNIYIWGYYTTVVIQTASSEVNTWINCTIEPFSAVPALALTDQITTGIVSQYVNLSGHVFSGGNTRHTFIGCAFDSLYGTSVDAVLMAGIDNATFVGCYSNSAGNAMFRFIGNCSNVNFVDHRDESSSTYFIQVSSGVTVSGLRLTGRSSRPIRGENTSVITMSAIMPNFMATSGTYSFDVYDCIDSEVRGMTNDVRVRHSAYKSRFGDYKQSTSWTLPVGEQLCPEFYWLGYSGGYAKYSRRIQNNDTYRRDTFMRAEISAIVSPEVSISSASGTYTPDLRTGCNYAFAVSGTLAIANPGYINIGPDDGYGQLLILSFQQDATGGHTVSFGTMFDLGDAAVSTTANACTTLMFIYTSFGKFVRML